MYIPIYYIKVGCKGVFITRTCYHDVLLTRTSLLEQPVLVLPICTCLKHASRYIRLLQIAKDIKLVFMLTSTEHEIYPNHRYQNSQNPNHRYQNSQNQRKWGGLAHWLASRTTDQGVPGSRPACGTVCCGLEQVTFTHCLLLVKPRKAWTDDSN